MNIFTKHYEKLILALLIVVFVVLVGFLLKVTSEAKNTSEADLEIDRPMVDYDPMQFQDIRFDVDLAFQPKVTWVAQNEGSAASDMFVPVVAAKCPYCEQFVPVEYFTSGKECESCGVKLSVPFGSFSDDADFGTRASDLDGDGLSNIFEEQHNFLNPNFPGDAKRDQDRDGFSNLYEYMQGTDLDDGESHPALTDLIFIENARPPQFGGSLISVDANKQTASLMLKGSNRARTLRVGQNFSADRRGFVFERVLNDNTIVLSMTNDGDKEFELRVGEAVELPVEIMTIMNLGTNRTQDVGIGSKIEVGNGVTGKQRWEVVSLDADNNSAMIKNEEDGVTFELTTQAKIPPRARLR